MENSRDSLATQTRHTARSSAGTFKAGHCRWHSLHHPNRRGLADDAQRPATLENLLSLLPTLGQTGTLGADPQRATGHGAARSRKKKAPTAAIIDSQSVRTARQCGQIQKRTQSAIAARLMKDINVSFNRSYRVATRRCRLIRQKKFSTTLRSRPISGR